MSTQPIEYGTIAVVPMGEFDFTRQYEVANLVSLDGSSYIAHTKPPVGTEPTNTDYWQVSAIGTNKATEETTGVVKPDGTTTEVDENGVMSVKVASQTTAGIVKGSDDINVEADGALSVNTTFEQAVELANIIAGEAIASVLGKVSKAIAKIMSLDSNALLKNMLSGIDANDPNKVPTSAYIHTLVERIGMGTQLTAGANLTEAANNLSSNLAKTNAKVTLNGVKNINGFTAVYSDRTDRAFQLYYENGEIASITFNNTGIWYDFYDGQKWKRVWKFNKPT